MQYSAYIYPTCIGYFVFDREPVRLREKNPFKSVKEASEQASLLAQGKVTEMEKQLAKRHRAAILGFKEEKTDIPIVFEQAKYIAISDILRAEVLPQLYAKNLLLTKQDIRKAVRPDIFIVQTSDALKELDKAINLLAKRLREWYSYYLPEFIRSIQSHEKLVELVLSKDRKTLLKEVKLAEEETMGAMLEKKELQPMLDLAAGIKGLVEAKEKQQIYLEKMMKDVCPNVTAIAGANIGAKLLTIAGSLEKLAAFPSSTVQILGAEKALFRHMKTGSRPPKYGVLVHHPLVTQASREMKGKVARALADKLSIAAKVDRFKGEFIGEKLRKDIEKRFPKKN